MPDIHPTAIVDPSATLADTVRVGPYATVGPHVVLGDRCTVMQHAVIDGHTAVGDGTVIYPHACVGLPPQDLSYRGEPTRLVVGRNNIIREHATLHTGTSKGHGVTTVGDNCLFMVNTHVAHDSTIGNSVIMANNAVMGGHVTVGDYAILGGNSAIQQFARVGRHAMMGGMSASESDIIPYGLVIGVRDGLSGLNLIGLRRRGYTRDQIHELRRAYRLLFAAEGTLTERTNDVAEMFNGSAAVQEIVDFIRADPARPICQPPATRG